MMTQEQRAVLLQKFADRERELQQQQRALDYAKRSWAVNNNLINYVTSGARVTLCITGRNPATAESEVEIECCGLSTYVPEPEAGPVMTILGEAIRAAVVEALEEFGDALAERYDGAIYDAAGAHPGEERNLRGVKVRNAE